MAGMKLSCGKNDRLHLDHVPLHRAECAPPRLFRPRLHQPQGQAFGRAAGFYELAERRLVHGVTGPLEPGA